MEESNLLVLNKLERLLTVCFKPKENQMEHDTIGYYARPDVLELKVNEK